MKLDMMTSVISSIKFANLNKFSDYLLIVVVKKL